MIRSTSRSVLAGLVVVGGLALAGCGAGQVAQTAQQLPTIDGTNTQVGELAIRNVALEYPVSGAYQVGDSARLRMVVVNQGLSADTLVSVSSPVADAVTISAGAAAATASGTPADTASATPSDTASPSETGTTIPSDTAGPSGSDSASATPSATPSPTPSPTPENTRVQIPPNAYVSFRGDGPDVELTSLNTKLLPAQNLQVTLTFANAGAVTLTIGVATPEAQIQPAPTVSVDPDSESEG